MSGSKNCEDAFIGCSNTFVDERGSKTKIVVPATTTDYAKTYVLGCTGMVKDDSEAVHQLQGPKNCSLSLDNIEASNRVTLIESNARKTIVGGGGAGKETASLVVKGTKDFTLISDNCETQVQSVGDQEGSGTYEKIVEGSSNAKIYETNKKTSVCVKQTLR